VIDGVIGGDLNSVNNDEIESIDILRMGQLLQFMVPGVQMELFSLPLKKEKPDKTQLNIPIMLRYKP